MPYYIDSHCHLDLPAFDEDRDEVILRAIEAGVGAIINPSINVTSSQNSLRIATANLSVYAAIGLHPNELNDTWQDDLESLIPFLDQEKVIAIGEIGLDRYHKDVPIETQKSAFISQLQIAREYRLPVIVHSREAIDDMYPILANWSNSCRLDDQKGPFGVLHSFEGNVESAMAFIDLGFLIGIAGPITYKNASDKHALAASLPISSMILETDSPYLTPAPHRGRRNEPAYLPQIGQRTAIIRGCVERNVMDATTFNAISLFSLGVFQ